MLTPREVLELEADIRWRRESLQLMEIRLLAVERAVIFLVLIGALAAGVALCVFVNHSPPPAATFDPRLE